MMPKELPVVYTKLRIAEIQMDRAIAVLLDDNDLVCAITLAGAAEEIFGNLLAANGESGWMTDVITDTVNMGKSLGHQWKFGNIKWEANWFRNELKHHDLPGALDDLPIPVEAALEIVGRAVENHRRLTGNHSAEALRYLSRVG